MQKSLRTLICSVALAIFSFAPVPAAAAYLQCAPFARQVSGIQLFGAAAGWWSQADGKYDRGSAPRVGSVLVFKASGAMRVGHVAMVSRIVNDREIKVTHANWSVIDGHRGQIERDVTVIDASPAGDWSEVEVWYAPIGKVGTRSYPVFGFVHADRSAETLQMARADAVEAPAPRGFLLASATRTLLP